MLTPAPTQADFGGAHPVPFDELDPLIAQGAAAAAAAGAELANFAREHVARADEVREASMRASREAEGILD